MRCVIRSAAGYYATVDGRPCWAASLADARVFPSLKLAQGVVRVLKRNRIPATVQRLGREKT